MDNPQIAAWNLEMQTVHHRLESSLRTARYATANSNRADRLRHCYGLCAALTTHHTSEDASLFPKLLADHPQLEPVIRRLVADHHVLAELITRFEATLRNSPAAHLDEDDELTHSMLDQLQAKMTEHFAYEERVLDQALDSLSEPAAKVGTLLGRC